jgi:hypothetical protein
MNRVSGAVVPPSGGSASQSTTSKYSRQSRSKMASKWISRIVRSWPSSASPSYMTWGPKCLSKHVWSRPTNAFVSSTWFWRPSASLGSSYSASQCLFNLTWSRPLSASHSYTISACKCISKLAWSRPPSASQSYTISASKSISKCSVSPPPKASLSYSIMAS